MMYEDEILLCIECAKDIRMQKGFGFKTLIHEINIISVNHFVVLKEKLKLKNLSIKFDY